MGQKTHPIGLRLGIIKPWNSRWYASDRNFADLVHEDMMVKRYINRRLDNAGIAKVQISRAAKKVSVDIMTSRPGIVIGRRGAEVDKLREELQLLTKKDIMLNIVEVRKPELDAQLVADSISRQLEGRISFRRAMKKALAATMKMGAEGIKIQCGGRLGGAEIARTEKYMDGRVPLHTLRADIDYATSTANTTYGCIGVKVWICRGEIMETGRFWVTEDERAEGGRDTGAPAPRRRGGPREGGDRGGKRPKGRLRRAGQRGPAPRGRRPEAPRGESGKPEAKREARPEPKPESKPVTKPETKPESKPDAGSSEGSSES
ncbi:30S ribosomal protein S3 [candidate division GN15 bacterium]|nr:30S ribosomal protein S3 [candidate division GN15 bacterium]